MSNDAYTHNGKPIEQMTRDELIGALRAYVRIFGNAHKAKS